MPTSWPAIRDSSERQTLATLGQLDYCPSAWRLRVGLSESELELELKLEFEFEFESKSEFDNTELLLV